jgi:hypothetical protein
MSEFESQCDCRNKGQSYNPYHHFTSCPCYWPQFYLKNYIGGSMAEELRKHYLEQLFKDPKT